MDAVVTYHVNYLEFTRAQKPNGRMTFIHHHHQHHQPISTCHHRRKTFFHQKANVLLLERKAFFRHSAAPTNTTTWAFSNGEGETRLESRQVRDRDSSRSRQGDLGHKFTGEASRDIVVAVVFGLDGSDISHLERGTDAIDVANLVRRVCGGGSQGQVTVDLVQKSQIDSGLGRGRDRGKQRPGGVGGSGIKGGETRGSREGIGSIGTNLDSTSHTQADGRANLGHVHDIDDTSGVQASLGVVDAKISVLATLEGKLDVGGELERSLQDSGSIILQLSLVEAELGEGVLGSNLGGKAAGFVLLGFDGDRDRACRLFGLEDELGGEVVVQEICRGTFWFQLSVG